MSLFRGSISICRYEASQNVRLSFKGCFICSKCLMVTVSKAQWISAVMQLFDFHKWTITRSERGDSPEISSSTEEGNSSSLKSFSLISHPTADMSTQWGTSVNWVLMTKTSMSQKFSTWGVSRTWWKKSLFLKQLQKCSLAGEYNLLLQ